MHFSVSIFQNLTIVNEHTSSDYTIYTQWARIFNMVEDCTMMMKNVQERESTTGEILARGLKSNTL